MGGEKRKPRSGTGAGERFLTPLTYPIWIGDDTFFITARMKSVKT
jgi:hypothetical protein